MKKLLSFGNIYYEIIHFWKSLTQIYYATSFKDQFITRLVDRCNGFGGCNQDINRHSQSPLVILSAERYILKENRKVPKGGMRSLPSKHKYKLYGDYAISSDIFAIRNCKQPRMTCGGTSNRCKTQEYVPPAWLLDMNIYLIRIFIHFRVK